MSLLHRIEHARDALAWEGDIPTQGRYTVGIAGEKFFREIQENGRFLSTVCTECGITYVPPRLYCEKCFAKLEEWVEVPGTGRVHTFTVIHLDLDEEPLPEPRVIAFIRLDGTDPSIGPSTSSRRRSGQRGGLVHYLDEVDPDQVCIGMPVEAVFKDKAEREGSIRDIVYFRPA